MLTKFLIKHFIPKNAPSAKVRASYSLLSSITGIICNITLFATKYFAGVLSGSVSIISDAFNNLSDCASCIVALLGGLLASKPADKDHPYGHGRIEYIAAMIIAVLIMLMGFELLSDSVSKIISPEPLNFSLPALFILIFSISVKLWMSFFNIRLWKDTESPVILAAAKDSRSDITATSAALITLLVSRFTSLPIDGIAGTLVSLFILKSGFDIIRETLDDILGKPGDKETADTVKGIILSHEKIIDIHDLMIHSYGPENIYGSCHVEINGEESFYSVHELVDHIEKRIKLETGINMTIHMDPVDTENKSVNACKLYIKRIISGLDENLTFHDMHLAEKDDCTEVSFDLVVPFGCSYKNEQLQSIIAKELSLLDPCYKAVITFDRDMIN
ncbi:MAG: cation diffusion facilitator family transporter [Ruminococcus sp.]